MKHRPGKIYGPAGLVAVSALFIVVLLVGGIAIGFTRSDTYRVSERIGELDRQNRDLSDKCRSYKDAKEFALSPLTLRNSAEVRGRLDAPTKEQLITLRRRPVTREPSADRRASSDPRFTALDIAFIRSTPDRNTAVR